MSGGPDISIVSLRPLAAVRTWRPCHSLVWVRRVRVDEVRGDVFYKYTCTLFIADLISWTSSWTLTSALPRGTLSDCRLQQYYNALHTLSLT